jgi:fatty-acyl-CoA synthase
MELKLIELDWLKKWSQYSPGKTAIQDGETGRAISYQQLYQLSCWGAFFLKNKYQIKKGDRVAVLAQNELEFVILFFALQRLGAILVPINYRLTAREVEYILQNSDPRLVLTEPAFVNLLENLYEGPILLLQGERSFAEALLVEGSKEIREEKSKKGISAFLAQEEDPVMILYTSGTTGAPKGAILTLKMIFWNSLNTTMRLNISQGDRTVIFLPFFHTGAWNVLTTPFLHRGATLYFLKKFDAEKVLSLLEDEKCTILFGVPTTMDMLSRSMRFQKTDLSQVRYAVVGGEPMPLPLIETWHKKGIPVRQGYGLTEFGPNVFSLNEEDTLRKIGSIGFANFYTETKIVSENGQEVGPGEVGELWLKGPMCMKGYWRNEKATTETIRDGWLATGDLALCDEEGYHYIVGRKKEMYKSGGENVYPVEVEQVLLSLEGIRETAVIGVSDPKWGEVGKAFIVLENSDLSLEEIQNHCLKNLAKFKVPKYFEFKNTLPKGDSGKILKRQLQDTNL